MSTDPRVPGPRRAVAAITPREHEILALFRGGRSRSQAARALDMPVNTVKWHAAQAYRKLGVASLRELMRIDLPPPRDRRKERVLRVAPGSRRGAVATCGTCGREFRGWTSRTRFCSRRCDMLSRAPRARRRSSRPCLVCGRVFHPYNAKVRHCSRACSRVTVDAKIRQLGLARRMPPAVKAERLRAQWRAAWRRKRDRLEATA